MSEFVEYGEVDGVYVSYTTASPRPAPFAGPEPEPLPPHVDANLDLKNTIEAEYYNRGREFKKLFRAPKTTSSFAEIKTYDPESRAALYDELYEFQRFLDKHEPKKLKKPASFLRDAGQSIVRGSECCGEIYVENP